MKFSICGNKVGFTKYNHLLVFAHISLSVPITTTVKISVSVSDNQLIRLAIPL